MYRTVPSAKPQTEAFFRPNSPRVTALGGPLDMTLILVSPIHRYEGFAPSKARAIRRTPSLNLAVNPKGRPGCCHQTMFRSYDVPTSSYFVLTVETSPGE